MKIRELAEFWQKIEAEPSRLKMTETLAEMFTKASQDEIDLVVYLSLGRLRPKFEGVEFNMAETMMLRVIAATYGVLLKDVEKNFKDKGDLGTLVEEYHGETLGKLSVAEVYKKLMDVAVDEGGGSQDRKVNNMARIIRELDGSSAKFVVRIPVDKLRLGFSDMTVLDGLSWMEKGDKSLRPQLERAFNMSADIGQIARVFKSQGLKGVAGIKAKVGVPIRPAKAERLPNAEKMVEKLGVFGVEGKWDGLRLQIHYDKGQYMQMANQENLFGEVKKLVRIFSRNLDNQTEMFPEVAEVMGKLPVKSIILDGEAVAYDKKTGKLRGFQETVTRKRKHGIEGKMAEVPIKVFVYDLLFLDGESMMEKSFRERRKTLEKIFAKVKLEGIELAEQAIVADAKELEELRDKYVAMGLEGVMCKKLSEPYVAGMRNFNWVKFKKTTNSELTDTLDCVVMGYYAGKGKRSGFGIGAFLVGVLGENGKIGTVAKVGTGLTDEQWLEMKKRADKIKVDKKPAEYEGDKMFNCDVWVEPKIVVEIMADEITRSPSHALGLALRFPRLVRFRDDKEVSEATTIEEMRTMI